MPFNHKVVGAEASIDDESFVLPDDLASLGELLTRQAEELAQTFPARQHDDEQVFAQLTDSDIPSAGVAQTNQPHRPAWPILRRVAALLLASLSVVWITSSGSRRNSLPSSPHSQPITAKQTSLPSDSLSISRVRAIPFWLINDTPQPAVEVDDAVPKVGTGPESEGWLDLLESQSPREITISM